MIGRPLSPYALTKYVNELYADVFARSYCLDQLDCVTLTYLGADKTQMARMLP